MKMILKFLILILSLTFTSATLLAESPKMSRIAESPKNSRILKLKKSSNISNVKSTSKLSFVPAIQKSLLVRALKLADRGDNKKALQILSSKSLKNIETGAVSDQIQLLRGRLYFNSKKFDKALEAYLKVPKTSPLWLSSVEERAWARTHLNQVNEAIADSHILMSPIFSDIVSPEAYHFSAYASHQICDFNRVFKIIDKFKIQNRSKIANIESEYAKTKSQQLKLELLHYSDVISQLNLIEADSIQRIYIDKDLAGKRTKIENKNHAGSYDLRFPFDEEDVWVDEIDQLKVEVKNCPVPFKKVVSL
jgi:tetratricopeptide (TPR) repeat protein